jgi:hypothetical protein
VEKKRALLEGIFQDVDILKADSNSPEKEDGSFIYEIITQPVEKGPEGEKPEPTSEQGSAPSTFAETFWGAAENMGLKLPAIPELVTAAEKVGKAGAHLRRTAGQPNIENWRKGTSETSEFLRAPWGVIDEAVPKKPAPRKQPGGRARECALGKKLGSPKEDKPRRSRTPRDIFTHLQEGYLRGCLFFPAHSYPEKRGRMFADSIYIPVNLNVGFPWYGVVHMTNSAIV